LSFTWSGEKIKWFTRALETSEYPWVFMPILETMLDTESTVLEIAAGVGPFSRMLAGRVRSVTALEPCSLALSDLRKTSLQKGIHNIRYVESTWEDWPGEVHDVIIAIPEISSNLILSYENRAAKIIAYSSEVLRLSVAMR
jgi:2-polyprenyl-3-methyl-5-hydroxy-6-metoxy-1,4-benzoquinol methylase